MLLAGCAGLSMVSTGALLGAASLDSVAGGEAMMIR